LLPKHAEQVPTDTCSSTQHNEVVTFCHGLL